MIKRMICKGAMCILRWEAMTSTTQAATQPVVGLMVFASRSGFVDPAGCVPYPALGNSGRLEARSQKMEEGLSGRRPWGAAAVYDEPLKL